MSENESSPPDEVVRWVVPFAHRWAEARAHVRFAGRMGVVVLVIGVGLLGQAALGDGDYYPGLVCLLGSGFVLALTVIGSVLPLRWPAFFAVETAGIGPVEKRARVPRSPNRWRAFRGYRREEGAVVLIQHFVSYRQWRGSQPVPGWRIGLPTHPQQQRRVHAALARHLLDLSAEPPAQLRRLRPSLLDGYGADVAMLFVTLVASAVAVHHRVDFYWVLMEIWLVVVLFGPETWLCVRDHGPLAPLRAPFRGLVFGGNVMLATVAMVVGMVGTMLGMVTSLP